ncbi:putative Calcium/calmodulin-regulated receptor-like kinase 1 [Cocos nucifera]|uniref:Putative Calcium/calmodulin-regulated receptor-like kinase 1 n=1 Tax=Cocos nucifera TaxID=13894 RepID=A0A8K0N2T9_COCNU|nr:putative Calcium/calmodulin-regulated receptor-like kinase 1 [Cocos nucifera]
MDFQMGFQWAKLRSTEALLRTKNPTAQSRSIFKDSTVGQQSPKVTRVDCMSLLLNGPDKKNVISFPGIQKYAYRDLQKATNNFTTVIGQGAFSPVYKARMSTGETVAVKVLSATSKQGEKEFHAEVMLLGRSYHRNLINLLGYCADEGQHMLVYVYMSNGTVASHLHGEKHGPLSWNLRVHIALDVARGLEYLHDGISSRTIDSYEQSTSVMYKIV